MKNNPEATVTNVFRSLMKKYGIVSYQSDYTFESGMLWYQGEPLGEELTRKERLCLDHSIRESLNQHLSAH